jgi:hypothetical protein
MASRISYSSHGFWTSNGICESVYDYILAMAERDHSAVRAKLDHADKVDGLSVCWRAIGLCPELEDILTVIGDRDLLIDLLKSDEAMLDQIADHWVWRNNLELCLDLCVRLVRGEAVEDDAFSRLCVSQKF